MLAKLDAIVRAFLTCALWTETDESNDAGGDPLDENYTLDDVSDETRKQALEDCAAFVVYGADEIDADALTADDVGHNFLLSRNRHGTGFWDRGYAHGDALHEKAKTFGTFGLYVGDDGKIYHHG